MILLGHEKTLEEIRTLRKKRQLANKVVYGINLPPGKYVHIQINISCTY